MSLAYCNNIPDCNNQFKYSKNRSAPDPLPPVIAHYHQPDVDARNPHNYPGPAKYQPCDDPSVVHCAPSASDYSTGSSGTSGTSIARAFGSNRGYADKPNGWNANDVTNTNNPQGLFPLIGRAAYGPNYINELESEYFKPPKSTVSQEDLRQGPLPQPDVFGSKQITGHIKAHVDEFTKFKSGNGALNHVYPGAIPSRSGEGSIEKTAYGFANGEKMTLRTGGFHPRRRIFKEEPSQRKQLYFSIRNASSAVGRSGSIFSEGRPELGHLELPFNSYVKEYHREALPTAGLVSNRVRADPAVVLQCTTRPEQYISWAGPKGTQNTDQQGLRLLSVSEMIEKGNLKPITGKEYSTDVFKGSGSQPATMRGY